MRRGRLSRLLALLPRNTVLGTSDLAHDSLPVQRRMVAHNCWSASALKIQRPKGKEVSGATPIPQHAAQTWLYDTAECPNGPQATGSV